MTQPKRVLSEKQMERNRAMQVIRDAKKYERLRVERAQARAIAKRTRPTKESAQLIALHRQEKKAAAKRRSAAYALVMADAQRAYNAMMTQPKNVRTGRKGKGITIVKRAPADALADTVSARWA